MDDSYIHACKYHIVQFYSFLGQIVTSPQAPVKIWWLPKQHKGFCHFFHHRFL